MRVSVKGRYLGYEKVVKRESGEVFYCIHVYDGGRRLVTPFVNEEQLAKISQFKFGDVVILDMEIWETNNGMRQRLYGVEMIRERKVG